VSASLTVAVFNYVATLKAQGGLQKLAPTDPLRVELYWRMARASYLVGATRHGDGSTEQKAIFGEGLQFAQLTGDGSWQGQKYIAIMCGLLQKFDGPSEKMAKGHKYKVQNARFSDRNVHSRISMEVHAFALLKFGRRCDPIPTPLGCSLSHRLTRCEFCP
jgi:hypothetical protein